MLFAVDNGINQNVLLVGTGIGEADFLKFLAVQNIDIPAVGGQQLRPVLPRLLSRLPFHVPQLAQGTGSTDGHQQFPALRGDTPGPDRAGEIPAAGAFHVYPACGKRRVLKQFPL